MKTSKAFAASGLLIISFIFSNSLHAQWNTVNTNDLVNSNAGNIGIGANPGAYKLDLTGTLRASGDVTLSSKLGVGTTSPLVKLHVQNGGGFTPDTKYTAYIGSYANTGSGGGTGSGLLVQSGWYNNDTAVVAQFSALTSGYAEVPRMTIKSNGKTGIGTEFPDYLLDVQRTTSGSMAAFTSNNGSRQEGLYISASLSSPYRTFLTSSGTSSGDLAFGTGSDERIRIVASNGNVGIGTTTPAEKLAVNGNIVAKKIKVTQLGWSDFVFADDYKLRSLEEIEKYISINKHLPEIPSAAEVESDGLDLGEMNKMLLQKVEELTLYMIDLKKENESFRKRLETLEEK